MKKVQREKPKRLGRIKCRWCHSWINGKDRGDADVSGRERWPAHVCRLCHAERVLRMAYPGQTGHLWMALTHLTRLMKDLPQAHSSGCKVGSWVSTYSTPQGSGHTARKNGCTCGLTDLVEALRAPYMHPADAKQNVLLRQMTLSGDARPKEYR